MFERFTEPSRRVVVLAQEEARLLNHNYIGTEHILLGLLHEENGIAGRVIVSLGLTLETARHRVRDIIGLGQQMPSGHIPFTPRAKKVLELSLREALALKNDYIGTEHILLGLIREGDGVGAQILATFAALPDVRERVLELATAATTEAEPLTAEWLSAGVGGGALPQPRRTVVRIAPQVFTEFRSALASIGQTLEALERRMAGIERQLGITPPAPAEAEPAEAEPAEAEPAEAEPAPETDEAGQAAEAAAAPDEIATAADQTAQAPEAGPPEESAG